jgi:hypothetical protein
LFTVTATHLELFSTATFEVSTNSEFDEQVFYDPSMEQTGEVTINLTDRVDLTQSYHNQYLIWTYNKVMLFAGRFYSYGYYFRIFDFEMPQPHDGIKEVDHYAIPD